ncbi:MAG: methyl-accepting chemotaxis protein, partial [Caldimicrobium sp.]
LYFIQQDLEKRLQLQVEKTYKAINALQEIRAQHIRWKVNVLTHVINEDFQAITQDKSFDKLIAFRKFNSYEVNPQVWKVLEENFSGMKNSIERMQRAKNVEEIQLAYNEFQNFSKRYLWEGIDKLIEEYNKFLTLEKENFSKKKMIFQIVYGVFVLLLFGLILVSSRFIGMGVKREIDGISKICREIAQGNLRVTLDLTRRDELGTILRALEEIKSSFNGTVLAIRELSEEIKYTTENLKSLGETASAKSTFIEMKIEELLMEMEGIMEDLKNQTHLLSQIKIAVEEINKNVLYTSTKANNAMEQALQTQGLLSTLEKASSEIESIVKFIRDIAEQTNLLALNASIEAARAGEAGKGFAVVANEVKDLARQTDEAGKEITKKIKAIQQLHENVISTVEAMITIFQEVKDHANIVASAVEEQTIALSDIESQAQKHFERAEFTAKAFKEIKGEYKEITEDIANNINLSLKLEEVAQKFVNFVEYFKTLKEDRRKFSRISIFEDLTYEYEGKKFSGKLKDISLGGIFIFSDYKPSIGSRIEINLSSSISNLKVLGEVLRIEPSGFAVKIIDLTPDALKKLRDFFASYLPPDKIEREVDNFLKFLNKEEKIS